MWKGSGRCPFLLVTNLEALRGFWGHHRDSEGRAKTDGGKHFREWTKPGPRAAAPVQFHHMSQLTVFHFLFVCLFLQTKNSEGEFLVADNRK